ncbi:MAG: nucleotidyltransferase family protein, partial [Clostridia bacterium]|nr:nucleotidyltransferase family protein [Clostridia bacterium]
MKILAIICEFNPFHNGHKYLIEEAKNMTDCDAVLCIMSGDFTQRGEMCIADKYTRAKHAVYGGADCVIQLPASFAVAPAEIFAKGAIKILSAIPEVTSLAFGCESGNKKGFLSSAKLLINETDKFKSILNEKLANGESYIKSYSAAYEACGGTDGLLNKPNNILALEYTKAILRLNSNIDIFPIKRIGASYNDGELKENFSSASAIRQNLTNQKVKFNLPDFVYGDIKNTSNDNQFENFLRNKMFWSSTNCLSRVYGGGEGLENKLKSLENEPLASIIEKATSKRYSSSRIRRMLCAHALGLYQDDCEKYLSDDLYIKPLAVKKRGAGELLVSVIRVCRGRR